jgi:iron complex outermembrane receptor protein
MAEGAAGGFGWRAQLGAMGGSDLRTPAGPLANSGFRSLAGSVAAGARGTWGSAQVTWTRKGERFEVAEDPAVDPGFTGYQDVRTDRVRAESRLPLGRQRLELGVGMERNERSEFASAGATAPTTGLRAQLVTADARLFHAPLGPVEGAVGVSFSRLGFEDFGRERFLPDYDWWNVGVYAFEQASLGPLAVAAGLRLDHRVQDARASALAPGGERRDWTALSGNFGVVVPLTADLGLVANVGRGFRAPQPTELYANGIHQGTLAFEVGDPSLGVERSLNLEAGLRWHARSVAAEVNVYRNAVDGFIYYRPTGEREPESGFEIFRFTQGEALLTGFEGSVRWRPARRLELMLGADAVRGTNRTLDVPLPFMPPFRALWAVAVDDVRLPGLGRRPRAAFALRGESMARQSRPDPEEFAPDGFTRLDLEATLAVPSRRGDVTLDVQLRNLTDASYARPLNRFKAFAREMGRNVVFRVGVPF